MSRITTTFDTYRKVNPFKPVIFPLHYSKNKFIIIRIVIIPKTP